MLSYPRIHQTTIFKILTTTLTTFLYPDIDECSANTHSCDVNAMCSNTLGSYACACKVGYSGDGRKCTGKLNGECTKHIVIRSGLRVVLHFLLRNIRASETRARVKITPRKNRRHAAGREKNEGRSGFCLPVACRLLSRGVIFTRAGVLLALLSLTTNRELLVV